MHFVGGGIRGNLGFLHMYEKIIQEHNVFFLCIVCYKNGPETGPDLVLIVVS